MADIAIENLLTLNVKAHIIAMTNIKFTTRNVLIVHQFDDPPMNFTGVMVQIRYPEVMPYGQAGWSYLQRITFDIALFKRLTVDTMNKEEAILTALAEDMLLIRQRLNAYDGGTGEGSGVTLPLAIRLYDSHQIMSPRQVVTANGQMRDCFWTSARFWGLCGTSVDLFKAQAQPSP